MMNYACFRTSTCNVDDDTSGTSDAEPPQLTPAEAVNTTSINGQSSNVGMLTYGLVSIVTLA
eukprot:3194959-Rhodomonas_salina.1